MTVKVDIETAIARPPGEVFAALTDVERYPEWLIASGIVRHNVFTVNDAHYQDAQWLALLLFVIEVYLLTAISGLTVGKRLLGIRVARLDASWVGPVWGLVRTALLLLVIPALVFNDDQRALHDRASNTVVVRI